VKIPGENLETFGAGSEGEEERGGEPWSRIKSTTSKKEIAGSEPHPHPGALPTPAMFPTSYKRRLTTKQGYGYKKKRGTFGITLALSVNCTNTLSILYKQL